MTGRILFLNRYGWPDDSATSQILTDLSVRLAASGHDVTVVTSRQLQNEPGAGLPLRDEHSGVRLRRLSTSRWGRQGLIGRALDYATFILAASVFVALHARRGDIVIAKTDPPLLGVALAPLVALRRARLVNWFQDIYPEVAERLGALGKSSLSGRLFTALRNWSVRSASLNVAIGERMRAFLLEREPGARIAVIPNWCAPLAVPKAGTRFREQHGLGGKIVFSYSGNLGRAHCIEPLLEAATRLRERRDLHFLIIGGGAKYARLEAGVRQAGLSNWTFLPYQPRELLAESLRAADVHLVALEPALEGLIVPSKIYGVLAAGRPCLNIGAPDGEVADLLRRHDCGITVPPSDVAGLEQTLVEIAADGPLRDRFSSNALQASERYSFDRAAEQWEQEIRGLTLARLSAGSHPL